MSGRTAKSAGGLFLAGVVAMVLSIAGAPAAYAADFEISGHVTMEQSPGVFVPAYQDYIVTARSVTGNAVSESTWTSGGFYSITVPEGAYRVSFLAAGYSTPGEFVPFSEVWYGDTAFEYDSPVVTVAGPVTDIDGNIPLGSTISGTMNHAGIGQATAYLWSETANRFLPQGHSVTADYPSGEYTLSGLAAGDYIIRYNIVDSESFGGYYWGGSPYPEGATIVTVGQNASLTGYDVNFPASGLWGDRLEGADRFGTSVDVSRNFFEANESGETKTPAVFIVNGLNFPDALSAGPAAALVGAPILLVTPTSIPAVVKAEIERIDPPTIYIIGGAPSVSTAVASQLSSLGEVVRIAGADRFDTSRRVAEYFFADSGGEGPDVYTAYVATGLNFPDALGAGPAAAFEGGPLLLVNGGASVVDAATASAISDLDINRVVIAGSSATVSEGILKSVGSLPSIDEVVRQGGADRYGTAYEIANGQNSDGGAFHFSETVFLATGLGFPDALAASSVAGVIGAPIYLVQPHCVPALVINEILRLDVKEVYFLGSVATLGVGVSNLTVC